MTIESPASEIACIACRHIAVKPALTHGWWDFGVSRAWPTGSVPAVSWWTMQDLLMRHDARVGLTQAGVAVMLIDARTEWTTILRCVAAVREAGACALLLVPPTILDDARARLAGDGVLVAPATTEPQTVAGLLAGLCAMRGPLNRLNHEVELSSRAQVNARRWIRRVDDELHMAARMQRDLLPRQMPTVDAYASAATFRPLWHVSGDVYRCWRLDEHRIGFMIADAMGHGVRAAMATMILAHELVLKDIHADGYTLVRPGDALRRLNIAMLEHDSEAMRFASALCGVADTAAHQITLAGAGHPHPLIVGASGVRPVELDGPVLGVFDDAAFTQTTITLQPGESLCMYTDGVEDALALPDSSGKKFALPRFAHEAIAESFAGRADDLHAGIDRFNALLDAAPGSLHRSDDVTLLLLSRSR